jgi:hypothetical protein
MLGRAGANPPIPRKNISKQDISAPIAGRPLPAGSNTGKVPSNPPLAKLNVSSPKDGRPIPDSIHGDVPRLSGHIYDSAPGALDKRATASGPVHHEPMEAQPAWIRSMGGEARTHQEYIHNDLKSRFTEAKSAHLKNPSVSNEITLREREHNLRSFQNHGSPGMTGNSPVPHLDGVNARRDVVKTREAKMKALASGGRPQGLQRGEPGPESKSAFKADLRKAKDDYGTAKTHLDDYEYKNKSLIKKDMATRAQSMPSTSTAGGSRLPAPSDPGIPQVPQRPKEDGRVGFSNYVKHEDGTFDGTKPFDGKKSVPGKATTLPRISGEIPHPLQDIYPRTPGSESGRKGVPGGPGSDSGSPTPSLDFPAHAETSASSMGRDHHDGLSLERQKYGDAKKALAALTGGEKPDGSRINKQLTADMGNGKLQKRDFDEHKQTVRDLRDQVKESKASILSQVKAQKTAGGPPTAGGSRLGLPSDSLSGSPTGSIRSGQGGESPFTPQETRENLAGIGLRDKTQFPRHNPGLPPVPE